jgi:hypothetical protein
VNDTVDIVLAPPKQGGPPRFAYYRIYASNLKRGARSSRVLGSVDFFLPDLDLHLHCTWLRDGRGYERVSMPRTKVETPDGRTHLKTLARWGSADAEERFQRAALQAIRELIARTATSGDRLSATPRARPRSRPSPSLPLS